jgi:site-specific DNA recombinase
MARAAIYARYSTELQSERSIDDQIALCERYAERERLKVVSAYSDAARSGGTMHGRSGLQDLLWAAENHAFDVIVVEAFDRLARDVEDLAGIYKRLKFWGVELTSVNDGPASNILVVAFQGMVGQLFREGNKEKVRRGMGGRIRDGLSAGGRAYGYRSDPSSKGKLLIDEEEARIVRRIFSEFIGGASTRTIAQRLNRDGIPGPRGPKWNSSTIHGNSDRRSGILNNALYDGRLVWNKVRMEVDPDTGKRVSRPNPEKEHTTAEVPELRILEPGVFEQAQKTKRHYTEGRPEQQRRPKRLLSGLLKCAACGSGMVACGTDKSGRVRIRCSAARESGTCPDPKTFYLDTVEELVVEALRGELRQPERLSLYLNAYQEERRRLASSRRHERRGLERKIASLEAQQNNVLDTIGQRGDPTGHLSARLEELENELIAARSRLVEAEDEDNVVELHPKSIQRYEQQLRQLAAEINEGIASGDSAGAKALRDVIEAVVVSRDDNKPGGVSISIQGKLNALVGLQGLGPKSVDNGGSGGGT